MATTRVYILARELGVKSSVIVKKCQDEGLNVQNHMATISAGMAATIREWFPEGKNNTTLEKPPAMTIRQKIITQAVGILENCPKGIRYSEFVRQIQNALPDTAKNTIHGTIWNLETRVPESVFKPARGLFLHTKYRDTTKPIEPKPGQPPKQKLHESAFYKPFADWLVRELEECTKAIAVGGNVFKDKWGTPDVIGIREPKKSDIIKLPTEIVSAEIKLDGTNLITAFGQACAYRLFSHKSYIVVPRNSPEDDIARLDALSRIFGVGLILFCPDDPKDAKFEIRARASKHDPDMFYVNRCMKIIEDELFG